MNEQKRGQEEQTLANAVSMSIQMQIGRLVIQVAQLEQLLIMRDRKIAELERILGNKNIVVEQG